MVYTLKLTLVCYWFVEDSDAVGRLLENVGVHSKYKISEIYDAKEHCLQNVSLITIATDLKVFDGDVSQYNITYKVEDIVKNQMDLPGIISGINMSSAVPSNTLDSVKNKFTPSYIANILGQLSNITNSKEFNTTQTKVFPTQLVTDLTTLRASIVSVKGSLAQGSFTYTPGSPSGTRVTAVIAQYQALCQAAIDQLDAVVLGSNSTIARFDAARSAIRTYSADLYTIGADALGYVPIVVGFGDAAIAQTTLSVNTIQSNVYHFSHIYLFYRSSTLYPRCKTN
jgi:hypothetical protein